MPSVYVRNRRAALATLALLGVLAAVRPVAASAHPLGNFTTNAAAQVTVGTDRVDVVYALDLAEIPALQAKQRFGSGGAAAYGSSQCAAIASALSVQIGGNAIVLGPAVAKVALPPGQGGLSTLRLECQFSSPMKLAGRTTVTIADENFAQRIGWRELSLRGDGVSVDSALPSESPSDLLRGYPSGAVTSPLRVTSGEGTLAPGGARLDTAATATGDPSVTAKTNGLARGNDRLSRSFTSLISHRRLSVPFAFGAVALACLLGAFHAVAPGHGKTLMAAYVVGRRGGTRQVLAIGSTVALAHTAGVVVLGVIVSTSAVFAPEEAIKWLSVLSGVLLIVVGTAILVRRLRGKGLTAQLQDATQTSHLAQRFVKGPTVTTTHSHGGGFAHSHVLPAPGNELRAGSLIAMGLAGGLVPSPSALVVLLGAIALGRIAFGIGLVAAYGIGMAATLMLAGLLLVRAEAKLRSWTDNNARLARMIRWFPVATAALLVIGGLSVTVRALGRI